MDTKEELTQDQINQAITLYMTLLERFAPELYEVKKVIDIFMPYIDYGEIHSKFIVQKGKIVRVESYPLISKKIQENVKT